MISALSQPFAHPITPACPPKLPNCCEAIAQHIRPEVNAPGGNMLWGRLISRWEEKQPDGAALTHVYASCIDGRDGSLYVDCSLVTIFAKCCAQLLVRPIYTLIKTAHHVAMLTIQLEVFCKGHIGIDEFIAEAMLSLKDIIRTPVYGVALMAASVAVLAAGVLHPPSLYDGRKLLGWIEQEANWGKRHTSWTLAKCFQPLPLTALEWFGMQDCSSDTVYPSSALIDRQLANLARSRIRKKREQFDPLTCGKLPPSKIYISQFYEKTLPIYDYIL